MTQNKNKNRRKKLDTKTKIIVVLGVIVLILALLLGSRATIHGTIPVDAMRDPLPFRQSCEIQVEDQNSSS